MVQVLCQVLYRQLHYATEFILIISFNTQKVDIIILALRGETQTQRGLLICPELLGPLHYTMSRDTIPMVVHANSTPWICVLGHRMQKEWYPGAVQSCDFGAYPTESRVVVLLILSLVILLVHTTEE